MATTTTERPAGAQFDRGTDDADAPRDGISVRTIVIALLGLLVLLVLTAGLAIVRKSYRPYRGC